MKKVMQSCCTVLIGILAGAALLQAFSEAEAEAAQNCATGVIITKAGPVCGKIVTTSSGKQAQAFLGIPFAESTALSNRWQPPVPKQAWAKIREATQFGPNCPQSVVLSKEGSSSRPQQNEDCLSLNIWTPLDVTADSKLPVMVFIYGGGFTEGSSSDPLYDGSYLAANKDVVLVSLNYRLGVLGFLASDELSGNYGFMDQQLALSWVQDNIENFGGDSQKVTLFGESAGAMSVGLHLFSAPGSVPLFRAAIMESNFLALPYKSLSDQINVGNIFKQGLNCRDLKCLQNTSVDDLLTAEKAFTAQMSLVFSGAKYYIPFAPAIDGALLTRQPIAADGHNTKPILLGTNKNEAVIFVEQRSISPGDYASWAASLYGLAFEKVIARYPAKKDNPNSALWARVQTDNFLICSSRYLALNASAPVYAYLFNHQPSFRVWGGKACRSDDNVCHGAELPFVFHSADKIGGSFTHAEIQLALAMVDYWTNFARHLHPNSEPALEQSTKVWPAFTRYQRDYMVFNIPELVIEADPYRKICNFWDRIGYDLVEPWGHGGH